MPSKWIRDGGLKEFSWGGNGNATKSAAIAALQIYVVLVTQAEEKLVQVPRPKENLVLVSQAQKKALEDNQTEEETVSIRKLEVELTYNALMIVTGLSRQLVAAGIEALLKTGRITSEKRGRKSCYFIADYAVGNWCKLPARALYRGGSEIPAFHLFQKRTICELNALKLMLYYAAARDNKTPYAMASFETIHQQTGVIEKNIPRANAFLISSHLLANLIRENSEQTKKKEPNKYFLTGYRDFFIGSGAALANASTQS
jgi:hypothetical protein